MPKVTSLKLQTSLYSDNLKTSSDEVRKITPVDNNSCNETVSSDNSINLEPVVNDANKDFQTSTDWVFGTQCKQIIQLQTPRTFDQNAYFRVHLHVCKTSFMKWDVSSTDLQKSLEIFKDYDHDICDIDVVRRKEIVKAL